MSNSNPTSAPYGSWRSPITADAIVAESVGLGQVAIDGDTVLWTESRPSEGGRNVIVRKRPGHDAADVNPPPFNARTRVQEYGGGAWCSRGGTLWFSNFDDQRIYRVQPGGAPEPITPDAPLRYADAALDSNRNRLICVREDHTDPDNIVNAIAAVPADGDGEQTVLASGWDFVASPRLSPDGGTLAWLSWNHPNMPWDGTHLWTAAALADGSLGESTLVAGGENVSVFQPEWSPDGVLHYVADQTGWWNLYRYRDGEHEDLYPDDAEYARPQWVFGTRTYGFSDNGDIVCSVNRNGAWSLNLLNPSASTLTPLDVPAIEMGRGDLAVSGRTAFAVAGAADRPMSLIRLNLDSGHWDTVRSSSSTAVDVACVSPAQRIEFPSNDGRPAYALYYEPRNPEFVATDGEKPPLLVLSHGGPTGAASGALDMSIQFWTTRGFAVMDVNYGGSVGYGRGVPSAAQRQLGRRGRG